MIVSATSAAMSGMAAMTQTATGSAAMATSTGMSHGGGGGMSMGGGCKISVSAIDYDDWMEDTDVFYRCYGIGTPSTLVCTLTSFCRSTSSPDQWSAAR